MSGLPKGWIETELSHIAAWGSGGTPSRSNSEYYGGSIPWIKTGELGQRFVLDTEETITELGLKNSSAKLFPKGSVAVAMYGATIGKTSILGIAASTNQACGVGIPFDDATSSEYLYHYLSSQKDAFIEAGKGGAQPNISQAIIKAWPIPLAPLPEQKRIADKLDAVLARVDACRDRLNRVPLILKRFRQSVLAAATSGRLTTDWRHIQSAEGISDNSINGEQSGESQYPNDWTLGALGNYISDGPKNGLYKPSSAYGNGTNILRIDNFYDGSVTSWGALKRLSVSEDETHQFGLKNGDIVINRVNSIEYLGKCALIYDLTENCVFESNMMRLRTSSELIPDFLKIVLCSPQGRVDLCANAKHAVNQASINQGDVRSFPIVLPPVAEQHEIVRRVETLFAFADRLEARLATARAATERLTPALLAKAFRGELVPQDPNDEPAAELLKRLAASRNESGAKPARRRAAKANERHETAQEK